MLHWLNNIVRRDSLEEEGIESHGSDLESDNVSHGVSIENWLHNFMWATIQHHHFSRKLVPIWNDIFILDNH